MGKLHSWLYPPRQIQQICLRSPRLRQGLRLAVAPDIHNGSWQEMLPAAADCDALLIPGDLVNRHREGCECARDFLKQAVETLPVFMSLGNHEALSECWPALRPEAEKMGVRILDNEWIRFRGICLGGLSSADIRDVSCGFLQEMAAQPEYRILMCHHPDWYEPLVRSRGLDLTLSGHAHGGQVQLFGRGIFAPGQGFLPKLTHGFYDGGHLLVSRGFTNSTGFPRVHNPCELLILSIEPGEAKGYWKIPILQEEPNL